jgi:hypothetical protein
MPWLLRFITGELRCPMGGTIKQLNKLLRQARETAGTALIMRRLTTPIVVAYADASWGSRQDGSSQGGYIVALAVAVSVTRPLATMTARRLMMS